MNRRNLAHIWAQQTREHGRASNFYFDGPTIYSYGPHFPIARFIERNGRRAVLFTTKTYSSSTGRHLSAAHGALHGLGVPVFHVQNPTDTPRTEIKAEYQSCVAELREQAACSRKYGEKIIEQAREVATEANTAAEFFGWRWRLALPELSPESLIKIREGVAKRTKAQKAKDAKRQRDQAEKMAEQVTLWRAGQPSDLYGYSGDTMLRVKGEVVQTSRGAEVPAAHARRIWPIIQRVVRTGQPYQRNGHTEHVGEFTIDAIAADGTLKAGCHTIKFTELQQCAAALGLAA
ncbi:MAG: hypothetical protein NUV51_10960 [Sulfuricaulis sp.]|nr:hypothetical protein [Sulfuricaulis sp.]